MIIIGYYQSNTTENVHKYFFHIQVTTLRISPKVLPLNRARYLWGCSFSLHLVELSTPETWNPQVMPSSKRFHFSHIFISQEFTTLLVLCFQCWAHTCAYSPTFSTGTSYISWRVHGGMTRCFFYCLVALSRSISCGNNESSSSSKEN